MKFNVGDKVIKEDDLGFLFNPYWKEQYRKGLIKIVTEANEKEFSIYNDKGRYNSTLENGHACGMNNYLIYYQSTGKQNSYPNPTQLLHLEEDREYIISKIKSIGESKYKESNQLIENSIALYKSEKRRNDETYLKDLEINLNLLQ